MSQLFPNNSGVSSQDRLGFTLVMGLALHAVLILGISFSFHLPDDNVSASRLDITLAHYNQDNAPEQADYLAQFNQAGSGRSEKKQTLTTTELADMQASEIQLTQKQAQTSTTEASDRPLITSQDSDFSLFADQGNQQNQEQPLKTQDKQQQRSAEIASLEAELDTLQQHFAKKPRIQRTTSVATKASPEARYLFQWQKRIEFIGNLYFPEQARQQGIYGDLRLLVAIYPNGSVREVKVLKSSGHAVLDQAALNIVKKAAPFPPFNAELQASTDVLEIIRTWQFRRNFSTQL